MHTTVRLECSLGGSHQSTGTGFFFSFQLENNQTIPLIVTNKHVIDKSETGTFVLTKSDADGSPMIGSHTKVQFDNFERLWIKHPDPQVDLAVFPIAHLMNHVKKAGLNIFLNPLRDTLIPTTDVLAALGGIEDITMIGYPNGIWDMQNNMPIVRRGITATNPKYDYNGLPVFVIDCACFPGSSGSPVMILNQGGFLDAQGDLTLGADRLILLGILFAGPQHVAEGEIKMIDVPLQQAPISLSRIPNNLGFVVKAQKLQDFKPLLLDSRPQQ